MLAPVRFIKINGHEGGAGRWRRRELVELCAALTNMVGEVMKEKMCDIFMLKMK